MTEPIPIRAIRHQVTRPGEVIVTEVVEFATPAPAPTEGRELPRGGAVEKCGCGLCESPLHLTASAPARRALPPPPARPWWRWRR